MVHTIVHIDHCFTRFLSVSEFTVLMHEWNSTSIHIFFILVDTYVLRKVCVVKSSCTQRVKTTDSQCRNNIKQKILYLLNLYHSEREYLQHSRQSWGVVFF
jgi:hypothetical protein